jgi:hypothetical protein
LNGRRERFEKGTTQYVSALEIPFCFYLFRKHILRCPAQDIGDGGFLYGIDIDEDGNVDSSRMPLGRTHQKMIVKKAFFFVLYAGCFEVYVCARDVTTRIASSGVSVHDFPAFAIIIYVPKKAFVSG